MSEQDPVRWLNDPDAPSAVSEMLRAAQKVRPTIAERAELGAQIGVTGSGIWAAPALKGAIAATLLLGGGLAYFARGDVSSEQVAHPAPKAAEAAPQPERVSADAPHEATVVGSADEPQSPVPSAETQQTTGTDAPPIASAKQASNRKLEGSAQPTEAQLLAAARGLIDTKPSESLRLLAQHQSLYPSGILAQEREVLRVRALKQSGKLEQAEQEASEFKKKHPDSAHAL